jgi:hypothetical protein
LSVEQDTNNAGSMSAARKRRTYINETVLFPRESARIGGAGRTVLSETGHRKVGSTKSVETRHAQEKIRPRPGIPGRGRQDIPWRRPRAAGRCVRTACPPHVRPGKARRPEERGRNGHDTRSTLLRQARTGRRIRHRLREMNMTD